MRLRTRDDAGVASIFVVLCAVLLIGVVGMCIDIGRAVAVTRSAQNSADAVALAMGKDCVGPRRSLSPGATRGDEAQTRSGAAGGANILP